MPINKTNSISNIKEKQQLLNLFLYRYFNIFNIIIFIAIFVLGFVLFVQPKYSNITKGVEQSNLEKREKLDNMQNFLSKLNRYKQEYNGISAANIKRLNTMLPQGNEIESLYTEIEQLVKQRGLNLDTLEVIPDNRTTAQQIKKTSAKTEGTGEISLRMGVTGADYDAFNKLIMAVEKSLRLIDIKSISYSPSDMTIEIEAVTYYLK